MKEDNKKIIAHSVNSYLFRTGSWLYSQLTNVKKFKSVVVSTRKQNLDVFPWPDAYFLSDLSVFNRFFKKEIARQTNFYYPYFYKLLKRIGVCMIQSHFWEPRISRFAAQGKARDPSGDHLLRA